MAGTYYRDHEHEHHLAERLSELLIGMCRDRAYELSYHESSLKGRKRSEVERYAKRIAREIRSNRSQAEYRGVSGKEPIPWSFRPLGVHEINQDEPATGIRVTVDVRSIFEMNPTEYERTVAAAKAGYGHEFRRTLQSAAPKFREFSDCLRMLLVQFCGEGSTILREEDLIDIMKSASLPTQIDEVWLAWQDWEDDHSYKLRWKRVRTEETPWNRVSVPERAALQSTLAAGGG